MKSGLDFQTINLAMSKNRTKNSAHFYILPSLYFGPKDMPEVYLFYFKGIKDFCVSI